MRYAAAFVICLAGGLACGVLALLVANSWGSWRQAHRLVRTRIREVHMRRRP